MARKQQDVAIVEVGEDYTDRLQTIEVENCTMVQAQHIAKDLGYQVIPEYCTIVQTIDEVHIIVTVEPKDGGKIIGEKPKKIIKTT